MTFLEILWILHCTRKKWKKRVEQKFHWNKAAELNEKKTRIHALLQDFDFGDWSQGVKSNMISQWTKKGMKNNSGKVRVF